MSIHNIDIHDKMTKLPYNISIFVLLSYWKNFLGTKKRVRICQVKRIFGVRAIEVRLYFTLVFSL